MVVNLLYGERGCDTMVQYVSLVANYELVAQRLGWQALETVSGFVSWVAAVTKERAAAVKPDVGKCVQALSFGELARALGFFQSLAERFKQAAGVKAGSTGADGAQRLLCAVEPFHRELLEEVRLQVASCLPPADERLMRDFGALLLAFRVLSAAKEHLQEQLREHTDCEGTLERFRAMACDFVCRAAEQALACLAAAAEESLASDAACLVSFKDVRLYGKCCELHPFLAPTVDVGPLWGRCLTTAAERCNSILARVAKEVNASGALADSHEGAMRAAEALQSLDEGVRSSAATQFAVTVEALKATVVRAQKELWSCLRRHDLDFEELAKHIGTMYRAKWVDRYSNDAVDSLVEQATRRLEARAKALGEEVVSSWKIGYHQKAIRCFTQLEQMRPLLTEMQDALGPTFAACNAEVRGGVKALCDCAREMAKAGDFDPYRMNALLESFDELTDLPLQECLELVARTRRDVADSLQDNFANVLSLLVSDKTDFEEKNRLLDRVKKCTRMSKLQPHFHYDEAVTQTWNRVYCLHSDIVAPGAEQAEQKHKYELLCAAACLEGHADLGTRVRDKIQDARRAIVAQEEAVIADVSNALHDGSYDRAERLVRQAASEKTRKRALEIMFSHVDADLLPQLQLAARTWQPQRFLEQLHYMRSSSSSSPSAASACCGGDEAWRDTLNRNFNNTPRALALLRKFVEPQQLAPLEGEYIRQVASFNSGIEAYVAMVKNLIRDGSLNDAARCIDHLIGLSRTFDVMLLQHTKAIDGIAADLQRSSAAVVDTVLTPALTSVPMDVCRINTLYDNATSVMFVAGNPFNSQELRRLLLQKVEAHFREACSVIERKATNNEENVGPLLAKLQHCAGNLHKDLQERAAPPVNDAEQLVGSVSRSLQEGFAQALARFDYCAAASTLAAVRDAEKLAMLHSQVKRDFDQLLERVNAAFAADDDMRQAGRTFEHLVVLCEAFPAIVDTGEANKACTQLLLDMRGKAEQVEGTVASLSGLPASLQACSGLCVTAPLLLRTLATLQRNKRAAAAPALSVSAADLPALTAEKPAVAAAHSPEEDCSPAPARAPAPAALASSSLAVAPSQQVLTADTTTSVVASLLGKLNDRQQQTLFHFKQFLQKNQFSDAERCHLDLKVLLQLVEKLEPLFDCVLADDVAPVFRSEELEVVRGLKKAPTSAGIFDEVKAQAAVLRTTMHTAHAQGKFCDVGLLLKKEAELRSLLKAQAVEFNQSSVEDLTAEFEAKKRAAIDAWDSQDRLRYAEISDILTEFSKVGTLFQQLAISPSPLRIVKDHIVADASKETRDLLQALDSNPSEDRLAEIADRLCGLRMLGESIPPMEHEVRIEVSHVVKKAMKMSPETQTTFCTALGECDAIGMQIWAENPEFNEYINKLRNNSTAKYGIDCSLPAFTEQRFTRNWTWTKDWKKGPLSNADNLRQLYDSFNAEYNKHLTECLRAGFNKAALCNQLLGTVASLTTPKSVARRLPNVLAQVFALWTLRTASGSCRDINGLMKPHCVQVLSVLQLLGAGEKTALNRFIQIGTGEGKSITLGVGAILLAFMGYHVDVVCYTSYLSKRDDAAFNDMFVDLHVRDQIRYGTIEELCERAVNSHGSIRDRVTQFLNNSPALQHVAAPPALQRALLIDEVDVFLSESFLGKFYCPVAFLRTPECFEVIQYIWLNHKNPTFSLRSVLQLPAFKTLVAQHPKFERLFQYQVHQMIAQVDDFEEPYDVDLETKRIGYKEHEQAMTYNYNAYHGHKTTFAYFYEQSRGSLLMEDVKKNVGFSVMCGQFSFAEIPRGYDLVSGTTGTLPVTATELTIVRDYKVEVLSYAPSVYGKGQFVASPVQLFPEYDDYMLYIARDAQDNVGRKRAVLVFFKSKAVLEAFRQFLRTNDIPLEHKVLVEESDNKDTIVRNATKRGQLTLLTRGFGRGIDFICFDKAVQENKGVHVIQTFLSDTPSEEVQIKGRTCRQGQNGSYSLVLLACHLKQEFEFNDQQLAQQDKALLLQTLQNHRNLRYEARVKGLQEKVIAAKKKHQDTDKFVGDVFDLSKRRKELFQTLTEFSMDGITFRPLASYFIVMCLDESGSMAGAKWEALSQAVKAFVEDRVKQCEVVGASATTLWRSSATRHTCTPSCPRPSRSTAACLRGSPPRSSGVVQTSPLRSLRVMRSSPKHSDPQQRRLTTASHCFSL
eukprot:TRINITY_DN6908_c0_g2_i2.p1 TRINITY_DN6908_c0_g2~~TRINITY_DN6908_c0_g2_i2.p1  ORF type:complete len:2516 (-),score=771.73 TRINITY_DN6908_c0_g2_i2:252-6812(-)